MGCVEDGGDSVDFELGDIGGTERNARRHGRSEAGFCSSAAGASFKVAASILVSGSDQPRSAQTARICSAASIDCCVSSRMRA